MENKQSPSKKKLKSIQEEKFIREVDYDSFAESSSHPPKKLLLEILQKRSKYDHSSQKVLVSIKPRAPIKTAIKTIYIAEKSRFQPKKHSDKSGSRLAIGDHSSYATRFSEDDSNTVNTILWGPNLFINSTQSEIFTGKTSASSLPESSTVQFSKCSNTDASYQNVIYNTKKRSAEKCYVYSQPPLNMTRPNNSKKIKEINSNKADIGTLVDTNPTIEDIAPHNILNLNRRLEHLEKKILRQELAFRSLDPNIPLSSSDEDSKNQIMKDNSKNGRPGCSYVEYSHVPETSAFQRYTQQPAPLSASKATTIQKEHNSEQYGRDFTLYDGITARGRRQCASVPCKRDDGSKMAAERVHKIRHKLNPVRDYRLMDTVHYLAQGEFAPRDDGIKLTPSREAVLSDIIWEDVCRTHWPNARLARRMTTHSERHGPKSELQRLIDCLLRERIAHVERRRRRHYRIVKLNHRHESCRPLGKTGDIIVASHKSKQNTDERELAVSDHNAINEFTTERKRNERRARRSHRSHDRLVFPDSKNRKEFQQDDCSPGTSYAAQTSTGNREATCCYHTSSPNKPRKGFLPEPDPVAGTENDDNELTIISSITTGIKNPRLVVKKNSSRKKSFNKEEPNLEHYILLPTLVVKSPSNMRRQKKFNELYHRILNVQLNKGRTDIENMKLEIRPDKKDIGLNINVTLSNSEENMEKMNDNKKQLTDTSGRKNCVYIHYNTPKVVGAISSTQLRQWALSGPESKLERAILAGQGRRLLEDTDALPLSKYHTNLIAKCDALHAAVEKGSLLELQEQLQGEYNSHKYVKCYDEAGVGLLHKAVFYNYIDITEWLVNNYAQLVHQRDSEGRTPLHYTASSRWEAATTLLERAGAVRGARDDAGHTLAHYRTYRTLLALPDMPARPNPPGLVIKRHNIRIWCHECDMGRLQRVVWEGQGARLLSEVSSQPIVKKFLEAVPYIMNTIRDVHNAVIQNDLEGLIKLTGDPVPPHALSCRDNNNMTPLHKAAGLGHGGIMKYIIERYPQGINDVDNDGRTPLHYAALVKDDQHTYNTLLSFGADQSAVDNKNKTPGYYINKGHDIDKNIFKTLPEAPRTPSSSYPSSWDWKILESDYTPDINKKNKKKSHKTSNENISSKNTNTISESIEESNGVMKNSSTQELISNFPELNDNEKTDPDNNKADEEIPQSKEEPNVEESNEIPESDDNKEIVEERDSPIKMEDTQEPDSSDNDKDNGENEKSVNVLETNEIKEEADHDLTSDNSEQNMENDTPVVEPSDKTTEELKDIEHNLNNSLEENVKDHENVKEEDLEEVNDITESENKDEIIPENNDTHDSLELVTKDSASRNQSPENTPDNDDQEHNTDEDNEKGNEETENPIYEDSKTSEGNTYRDISEDDDDVQVQGSSHHEHSDIHTKSPTFRQNNGSAIRDKSRVSSGNPVNGRNVQESLIEGLVSSEAEKETEDASITQREGTVHDILIVDNEIDPEVSDLINTANMEMLATLVLNGEGSRLIGRHSGNLELQAFLDNVPTYMQKINRVHIAAREGNIKDLQAALDRRKFAIARDPISANGATPLHVSVVFSKTTIIKYLGGRFPETLSAVDFEGRTALHYAAVLPDNGHYYNLLQQLGSNSKDLDDSGRSAEDYYKNPTLLTFKQLHVDFGVSEEEAQSMFSDKGISHAVNGHLDIPIFQTEEGRYLAKCKLLTLYKMANTGCGRTNDDLDPIFAALGDPLIKGLTEVANIKPKDPIAFLATYLQNFPEHEKPGPGTQESNVLMTKEAAEFENDYPPFTADIEDLEEETMALEEPRNTRTATKPRPIDVITVEPQTDKSPDAPEIATSSADRDEHGQSMLHFAAARTHTNNALFQLLQESDVSLGFRDELYRTARDVSIQANVLENTAEIDRWVLHLAARGKTDKIMELLLQGYDHILDIVDEEGVPILEVVGQRGDEDMNNLLASIPAFEESRESLHAAARRGDLGTVSDVITGERGRTLARSHDALGRTALHAAVLAQHEDVVGYFADTCPELLRVGDNLERTPLHYAMGVEKMESLSRILIKAGAKRVLKDLKGRQPSYYFMNKSDILRLKEEEVAY